MEVIVVGGGVAGTASAIGLRRLGAEVRLYEAYPDPGGEVGSYLSIAANGLHALDELGCLARVQARGYPVARQRMWSGDGKLLGDVPRARIRDDDLHSITLMRAALVAELRLAAQDAGVTVLTGERLVDAAEQAGRRVVARFAGGRTDEADLLVGADGIWSATRALLNPGLAGPQFAGQYTVSGVSTGVDVPAGIFNIAFCRNGAFLWVRAPGGEVWWQAQVTSDELPARSGTNWSTRLGDLYRGEPEPLRIIAGVDRLHPVTVNHFLPEVPVWHSDRLVLVGDAAHPIGAGQGASMAIEDAVALVAALAAEPVIGTALAGYERSRRPRIREVLKVADDNRRVKKSGPVRRRLERLVMPIVIPRFYEKATAWLYGAQPPSLAGLTGRTPAGQPATPGG